MVSTDRARDNEHKLKHRKFSSEHQEKLFYCRVLEHWNSFPRDLRECLPLEILRSRLNIVLNKLLWMALLEQEDWTRWTPNVLSSHCVILLLFDSMIPGGIYKVFCETKFQLKCLSVNCQCKLAEFKLRFVFNVTKMSDRLSGLDKTAICIRHNKLAPGNNKTKRKYFSYLVVNE